MKKKKKKQKHLKEISPVERLTSLLEHDASSHQPTLKPHSYYKDKFQVTFFYMHDHNELIRSIEALVYLCKRTMDPEEAMESELPHKEIGHIHQALCLISRLTPKGDEVFMDAVNTYFRQTGLRKGWDMA